MDIVHHYIERGEGEPLILLHGNGEESGYFSHQIGEFARQFHVYAIDTRGHGKSPRGEKLFTIRQFADDLLDFMTEQNLPKAHLLGFSDGANIAMVFAINYPDRVNKLILNGGNLNPGGVKWSVQFPIEIGYRIAKFFANKHPQAKQNAELLGLMVNDPNLRPEELSTLSMETLVIAGTRDMIKQKHTELIAKSIPNAELVFVEGSHFVANKNPAAFNEKVLQFLMR